MLVVALMPVLFRLLVLQGISLLYTCSLQIFKKLRQQLSKSLKISNFLYGFSRYLCVIVRLFLVLNFNTGFNIQVLSQSSGLPPRFISSSATTNICNKICRVSKREVLNSLSIIPVLYGFTGVGCFSGGSIDSCISGIAPPLLGVVCSNKWSS